MRKLSLMLFLVACGDDGVRHTPDAAPTHDGAADSPIADAAPNPVTIAAVFNGAPVAGVHVYFQNADSTLVLATTTDATGTASAVMAAGGYVTAINPYGAQNTDELDTFAGVKPGDHLVLHQAANAGSAMTVNVVAPSDGKLNNNVYSPCNTGGAGLAIPQVRGFLSAIENGQMTLSNCGSATDFLVIADDGTDYDYLYGSNMPVSDQGTVDLTGGTYSPTTVCTLTYTNLPSAQSLSIEADAIDPLGLIYIFGNETPSDQPTATIHIPTFPGESDVLQTTFNNIAFSRQILLDWGHLGSAFTTDVGARALNNMASYVTFDQPTHAGSATLDTSAGTAADFSLLFLSVTRTSLDKQWNWNIVAPFGASVALPVLPTDVFDYNVGSADSAGVNTWINGKVPGGYDAVRDLVLSAASPAELAIGGSGAATFVVSQRPLARTQPIAHPQFLRHRTR